MYPLREVWIQSVCASAGLKQVLLDVELAPSKALPAEGSVVVVSWFCLLMAIRPP